MQSDHLVMQSGDVDDDSSQPPDADDASEEEAGGGANASTNPNPPQKRPNTSAAPRPRRQRVSAAIKRAAEAAKVAQLETEVVELREKNKSLGEQKKRLESEVRALKVREQELERALLASSSGGGDGGDGGETAAFPGMAGVLAGQVPPLYEIAPNGQPLVPIWNELHPFKLEPHLPECVTDGDALQTDRVFKKSDFGFPHRVHDGKFVVESRLQVRIELHLKNKDKAEAANEFDLVADGHVRFRLDLVFADSQERVMTDDFETNPDHLFDPPESQIAIQAMNNGKVSWTIRIKNTSARTRAPTNRLFKLRVTCLRPELSHLGALSCSIPVAFKVVSRQYPAATA